MQRPFDPHAGFVGEVEPEPHGAFPADLVGRLRWALNAPLQSPAAKSALFILAFHADATGKAWPAVETIAREASIGRRTVFRALENLEADGWIATYQRLGRSTMFWPKARDDVLCRGCWRVLPGSVRLCPSCGAEVCEWGAVLAPPRAALAPRTTK